MSPTPTKNGLFLANKSMAFCGKFSILTPETLDPAGCEVFNGSRNSPENKHAWKRMFLSTIHGGDYLSSMFKFSGVRWFLVSENVICARVDQLRRLGINLIPHGYNKPYGKKVDEFIPSHRKTSGVDWPDRTYTISFLQQIMVQWK